jgi:hypothetical protein
LWSLVPFISLFRKHGLEQLALLSLLNYVLATKGRFTENRDYLGMVWAHLYHDLVTGDDHLDGVGCEAQRRAKVIFLQALRT